MKRLCWHYIWYGNDQRPRMAEMGVPVVITCEAVVAFAQAVLAGGFLAGHYDLLAMYQANASLTGIPGIPGSWFS
jgi:hypothetical protein